MIEGFAAACGVEFRTEWRRELDIELASIEPMLGAHEVLHRLRKVGFRIALASNLAPAYVKPALRILDEFIDVTCFSCDPEVRAVKPEPAFFDALETQIGFPAHEILMVGDSLTSDIKGAKAAGMHALHLVPNGAVLGPGQISRLTDVLSVLDLR